MSLPNTRNFETGLLHDLGIGLHCRVDFFVLRIPQIITGPDPADTHIVFKQHIRRQILGNLGGNKTIGTPSVYSQFCKAIPNFTTVGVAHGFNQHCSGLLTEKLCLYFSSPASHLTLPRA